MGAGQFGARAAERLRRKNPEAVITVVDQDLEALDRLGDVVIDRVHEEAVSYLDACLNRPNEPQWVIPAVPIHLAFEWVRCKLEKMGHIEIFNVPEEVKERLPNPKTGNEGQIFLSYADFRCPDHCTEPYDVCTWTGKPRKGLLYRRLEEIVYKDFRSVVIRSHQLAPGVGGYQPESLRTSLAEVVEGECPILYATACLCHGVMHAFRFFKTPNLDCL
jgi:hypothetical protein